MYGWVSQNECACRCLFLRAQKICHYFASCWSARRTENGKPVCDDFCDIILKSSYTHLEQVLTLLFFLMFPQYCNSPRLKYQVILRFLKEDTFLQTPFSLDESSRCWSSGFAIYLVIRTCLKWLPRDLWIIWSGFSSLESKHKRCVTQILGGAVSHPAQFYIHA